MRGVLVDLGGETRRQAAARRNRGTCAHGVARGELSQLDPEACACCSLPLGSSETHLCEVCS